MGKKKICACCKQEYEDTKKQKMQRKITNTLLKQIEMALPGIEETINLSEDFCFKCYKKAILQAIGPTYKAMLGEFAEEEETQAVDQDSPGPGKT